MEVSPAGVACNPRDARVKSVSIPPSPTDDQPPPRQEREAVVHSWLRQVRDGAGFGGGAREQLHTCEEVIIDPVCVIQATHHHLS